MKFPDRPALSLALAALAASTLAPQCAPASQIIALPSSGEWSGKLELTGDARLDFRLDLPEDAVTARVKLASDVPEVDLHAQPGRFASDLDEAPYLATDSEGPPSIELDRLGSDSVAGASWYFSVHWPFGGPPHDGERRVERANVTLTVETFRARVDGELTAGSPVLGALDAESGGFRSYRVVVPTGAGALRIDLSDVESDLDLYARAGSAVLDFDDKVAFAEHSWGRETLLITKDSDPPLVPGPWYVDVVDALGPTRRLPFRIEAGFGERVPERLLALPALPDGARRGGLAGALYAVVELSTPDSLGSGTLLTRDGWILTNAHLVGDDPEVEIVVALLVDPTRPAEESFRARAVRVDHERDLALVKIESGLYGQALPTGYELPTLALGDPGGLEIGDTLWLVGYPATGGTGSRVTVSATRGIVSGFERADFGLLLKTDAEITQGNSGGAALDERGLLVGVPTSTVENGSGQIGYVHPIDALPAPWRALLAR